MDGTQTLDSTITVSNHWTSREFPIKGILKQTMSFHSAKRCYLLQLRIQPCSRRIDFWKQHKYDKQVWNEKLFLESWTETEEWEEIIEHSYNEGGTMALCASVLFCFVFNLIIKSEPIETCTLLIYTHPQPLFCSFEIHKALKDEFSEINLWKFICNKIQPEWCEATYGLHSFA